MSQFTLTTHDGAQPSQLFELKKPVSVDDITSIPSVENGYYLLENAEGVSLSRQGNALHLHSDDSGVPAAVIPDFYETASLLTVPAENNLLSAVATADVQEAPMPLTALMDTPDMPWSDSPVVIEVETADGEVTDHGTTTDTLPTVHGFIEQGKNMVLNIYANTIFLGTAQVGEDGNWSFTPPHSFEMDSSYTFQVLMKDPGGSRVLIAMPFEMSETANAPAPDDLPQPGNNHIIDVEATDAVGPHQGAIANNGNTDDLAPVIGGTIYQGHHLTLQIFANTKFLGTVTVGDDDTWSFQLPELQEHAQYDIQVLMRDPGGSSTIISMPFVFNTGFDYATPTITSVTDNQGLYTGTLNDGQPTDDTTPTFTGTSDPGVTINVYDGDTLLGTATADDNGNWTFTPTTPLSGDGEHVISVTASDGTSETSHSAGFDLNLDTVCEKPVITGIDDEVGPIKGNVLDHGFITDAGSVVVSGTSEPGSTLTLFFTGNGDSIDSIDITPNADGTWSVPVDFMGVNGEGSYTYWVLSYDAAGNKAVSDKVTIVYDNTPPNPISGEELIDDYGPKQGPIISGDTTDDTQPTYKGKAEPGDTVHIYDGTNEIGTATADKDGNWTFTPADPLDQGDHSFSAIVVDGNGSESAPSQPIDFTVQTLVAQVTIDSVTNDLDPTNEVAVANNGFTNDPTPTLHGTATIGSTVMIYDVQNGDKVFVGSAVADGDGNWTFTPDAALADGEHDFVADVTLDSGDNAETTPWVITIDTVIPDQIDINVDGNLEVYDDVPQIIGDVTNGGVTNDNMPDFSGNNEQPGNTITILDGKDILGTAIVDANGHWSFTPANPMADGPHVITLETTDQAGNTSVPSDPFNFTIDTVAPDAATGEDLEDNVGPIVGPIHSGDTTDDPQPEFSGKGEPGATVYVYDNGDEDHPIGSATVDDNGDWSFKPTDPLADGQHSFDVVVVDPAGNESPASTPIDFTVDTRVPSVTLDGVSDDVAPVVGDIGNNGYTNDNTPTLHGTATAGAQVNIYDQDGQIGTAIAKADGTWTFTPASALADGEYDFSATVVLPATGESAPTDQWVINIDTSVPDEIDINSPDNLEVYDDVPDYIGDIAKGGVTNDNEPTFSGKNQEPGNTITILDGGLPLGTAIVQADGTWSFTPVNPMSEGDHTITLESTDLAGNTSPESDPFNFTIDTTAPDAATDQQLVNDEGQTNVPITEGSVTDDTTPLYEGHAEANSTVHIYDVSGDGKKVELGTAITDANGNWSFNPPNPLADGHHSFSAVVEDAAGNSSPASDPIDFIVSTQTATVTITHVTDDVDPVTGDVANNGYTNDTMPTLTGTATANETVTIFDGKNGSIGTAIADAEGNWTFTPATPLSEGEHDFTASVTIAVSGETATSDVWVINVDTVAPDQIDINLDGNLEVYDDVPAIIGDVTNGGVTNDNMPDFSGKNEVAGNTIIILDGGKPIGEAVVAADGSWSFTPATPMADGPHVITLEAKDLAGNTSTPSDPFNFTIDTVPPDAAKDIVIIDDQGDEQGTVVPGGATDDTMPTIDGKAEPGSTVIIYDNGSDVPMGSATAHDDGTWSFTPDTPMDDGPHSIDVVVVDPAGNESSHSDPVVFSIIHEGSENFTGQPNQVLELNQALALDSGLTLTSLVSGKNSSNSNGITSDGMYYWAPESFEGTALDLLAKSVTKVEFGGETNEVSFDVADVSDTGGYVEYYSADNNLLNTQDIPVSPDLQVTNIAWEAPEGQTISYIEIHVGSEDGDALIRVDNFQWGDSQVEPLSATHAVAQTADLPASVEHNPAVVDVHQAGGQLTLDMHDVLSHGQQNMLIADGKAQVAITGEAGEHVELTGVSESSLAQHGTVTSGGVSYDVYSVSGNETELLVQHGLDLHTTA